MEDRCLLSGGVLDPTFGTGGLVTNTLGTSSRAMAVATYPIAGTVNDGKIVAAGDAYPATGKASVNLAVARYNLNGTLDSTFGGTGAVFTIPGRALDVAVQPDGKVLAAGQSGGDFAVVRYNANGTPDASFGSRGLVVTDINKRSNDVGEAIVLQPDGKIVVAGLTSPHNTSFVDLVLVRYNTNGSLDTSFDTDGKLITRFSAPLVAGYTTARVNLDIDPTSGKFVVGAQPVGGAAVVARVNTNGTLDSAFGPATGHPGYVNAGLPYGPAVAVQTDGHIVVTGITFDPTTGRHDIGLQRLDPDGTSDTSFGSGGFVTTSSAPNDNIARAVTIQSDGNIVVAGDQINNLTGGYSFLVARYAPDGSLEATFGDNGVATGGSNGQGQSMGLALEPDGRIILAGYTSGQFPGAFSLARFLATGPQIDSFVASPNPVTAGDPLTLTASDVSALNPGSTVSGVAVYRDANGNGVLDSGIDILMGYATPTGPGTWVLICSTAGLSAGEPTFFAVAEDSYGVFGDPFATTISVI